MFYKNCSVRRTDILVFKTSEMLQSNFVETFTNKILTISDILVQSLLLKPQTWSHPIAQQYIRNIYKQAFLCLALIMCTNSAKHRGNITHFNIYKINVGST